MHIIRYENANHIALFNCNCVGGGGGVMKDVIAVCRQLWLKYQETFSVP
jgi:hypothetical protein